MYSSFDSPILGIADLKSGKIVTPLPPKETFLDDPLRVLRALRFGIVNFLRILFMVIWFKNLKLVYIIHV